MPGPDLMTRPEGAGYTSGEAPMSMSSLTDPVQANALSDPTEQSGPGMGAMVSDVLSASTSKYGLIDGVLPSGGFDAKKMGSSGVSSGLSVLAAANTAIQHEPMNAGAAGYAEKAAMGATDGAWGLAGGPAAVVDNALGGNGAGLLKASVGSMIALGSGGEAREKFADDLTGGNYGAVAGMVGVLGDAAGQAYYGDGTQDYDTSALERLNDGLQNGSELNPITHASRFGNWLADQY